ncbi:MAG: cadmium-translocating P-type ATPase [Betaproteobacteria bacterium]|nr:MAG: cadmium-translocating P-type ATPase [Betaproteobacteria bacterium]
MSSCFHCGLPVVEPGRYSVVALGAARELCCAGCEAVARTIVDAGLESYYQTRSAPAPAPVESRVDKEEFVCEGSDAALIVDRVRCAACLWLVEQTLRRVPGVTRADVNYTTQRAQVAWDPARAQLSGIIGAVRAVGYDALPYEPRRQDELERRERRSALWRLFVAAFGAMQVMMYALPAYIGDGALTADAEALLRWASLVVTAPVLFFACGPFFSGARQELRQRRIGLDTPIALGLAFGFAASAWATVSGGGAVYFDSISMLAFLLLGARYLEGAARRRAARALDPLLRLGSSRRLEPGTQINIPPGQQVPADGVVVAGRSSADESLLTGESRPIAKGEGDELIAGSVNLEQPLVMRVTRSGAGTRAAGIARLVERAVASRPRLVDAADAIARRLTWAILFTAAAAGLYFSDPWIAVAVLVVACPCALALAAPAVLTRAGAALLERGALLTRARALEALDRADDVVLDKTGTLTTGRLALGEVLAVGRLDAYSCLRLAAALEATSRHPIARAFPRGDASIVEAPRHEPAQGIEGKVEHRVARIGTEAFCRQLCDAAPPGSLRAADFHTRVFLADETGWLAVFELHDELRPEARELVATLAARNIEVHLASGDAPAAVAAVARRAGIERFAAGMTPQDKFEYVARLQHAGRVVVMVGDGLNDAPVLARADASFAMGSGADAAQLHADVVLTGSSLAALLGTLEVARRAMRLVRQNLGWALAYNALALPLAALGWIGPWQAALAMGASSLTVLLNALRPLGSKPTWKAFTSSFRSPSPSYS